MWPPQRHAKPFATDGETYLTLPLIPTICSALDMDTSDNDSRRKEGKWSWAYRVIDVIFVIQVIFVILVVLYFVFGKLD